jgi:hypothetical protein
MRICHLLCPSIKEYDAAILKTQLAHMTASKQSLRPSVHKLSSFDIRSIGKKPPAPGKAGVRSGSALLKSL